MFISEQSRRFGRNISNFQPPTNQSKNEVPKKLPRVVGSVSVTQESNLVVLSDENTAPQNMILAAKLPESGVTIKQQFQVIEDSDTEDEELKGVESVWEREEEYEPMSVDFANMSLEDIDSVDSHDPQFVTEYVSDIYEYLREKEVTVKIPESYMENFQKELLPRHRDVLINWICEVYLQLKLLSETLFLAVDIVDRLLSVRTVIKRKLHLVGLGALMIASKFEETYAPSLKDLRFCSENAYTEDEMLRVERVILNALDFNLCIPSPLMFLRRYSKAARSDTLTHTLSKYLTELSVVSYAMIKYLPSQIAAASVYIARRMENIQPLWHSTLVHYSSYKVEDIIDCAITLNELLIAEHTKGTGAIYRKYSSKKLLSVARIQPAQISR